MMMRERERERERGEEEEKKKKKKKKQKTKQKNRTEQKKYLTTIESRHRRDTRCFSSQPNREEQSLTAFISNLRVSHNSLEL